MWRVGEGGGGSLEGIIFIEQEDRIDERNNPETVNYNTRDEIQ